MHNADNAFSAPGPACKKVRLLLSVDVEEEGLFSGRYARRGCTVNNVPHLVRLAAILARFSLPVTLLCTHRVFSDRAACSALDAVRKTVRTEIGAHLHHWDTPPFEEPCHWEDTRYICPGTLAPQLFRQRLDALFTAGGAYNGAPLTSFRMGRWHLHHWHWPHLAEAGVCVDSSVRPLHCPAGGPDFFAAPAEPYYVPVNGKQLIESPMTCLPLYKALPSHVMSLKKVLPPGAALAVKASMRTWGILGLTPVYHPLWAMKCITRAHLAAGGRFLSMTCHSSELMPGGAPHMPDEGAVNALFGRIESYLAWLHELRPVQGMLLDDLRSCDRIRDIAESAGCGDWIWRRQAAGSGSSLP